MVSTTTTAAGGASGASGIDWDDVTMSNTCELCFVQFDPSAAAHVSLCSICQEFSGANDIYWGNDTVPGICEKCGVQYDCTFGAHASWCGVCQDLMDPDNLATDLDTPMEMEEEAEETCETCGKLFLPSERNDGVNCTPCCNGGRRAIFDTISPGELSGLPRHILALLCEEVDAAHYSTLADALCDTVLAAEAFEVLQSLPGALSADEEDQMAGLNWHWRDDL